MFSPVSSDLISSSRSIKTVSATSRAFSVKSLRCTSPHCSPTDRARCKVYGPELMEQVVCREHYAEDLVLVVLLPKPDNGFKPIGL